MAVYSFDVTVSTHDLLKAGITAGRFFGSPANHHRVVVAAGTRNEAALIAAVPAGEHVDTDPVALLNDWLGALAGQGVDATTGPLFRAITRNGRLYKYGRLSPAAVNELVQRAALRVELPDAGQYSAHSLRAAQATADGNPGVDVVGAWKVGEELSSAGDGVTGHGNHCRTEVRPAPAPQVRW